MASYDQRDERVDILLATYNGERYLAEQLDSLLGQTYRSWRLLVSDDGSTDQTVAIVNSYARRDERIGWAPTSGEHRGSCANFLGLLACSRARYVMFCDQDDFWHPYKVELSLAVMRDLEARHPAQPALVFSDMEVVDCELEQIAPSFERYQDIDPCRSALMQVMVSPIAAGCAMMLNAALCALVLRAPLDAELTMHDWWTTLVASAFGHIAHVDMPLVKYRQHEANAMGSAGASLAQSLAAAGHLGWALRRSMHRSAAFCETYGAELAPAQRRALEDFARIPFASRVRRLLLLARSGAWKRGLMRDVGELVTVLLMDKEAPDA